MTTRSRPKPPKRRLGTVFQRKQDGRWAASVTVQGRRVTRYVKPEGSVKEQERAAHAQDLVERPAPQRGGDR